MFCCFSKDLDWARRWGEWRAHISEDGQSMIWRSIEGGECFGGLSMNSEIWARGTWGWKSGTGPVMGYLVAFFNSTSPRCRSKAWPNNDPATGVGSSKYVARRHGWGNSWVGGCFLKNQVTRQIRNFPMESYDCGHVNFRWTRCFFRTGRALVLFLGMLWGVRV